MTGKHIDRSGIPAIVCSVLGYRIALCFSIEVYQLIVTWNKTDNDDEEGYDYDSDDDDHDNVDDNDKDDDDKARFHLIKFALY